MRRGKKGKKNDRRRERGGWERVGGGREGEKWREEKGRWKEPSEEGGEVGKRRWWRE